MRRARALASRAPVAFGLLLWLATGAGDGAARAHAGAGSTGGGASSRRTPAPPLASPRVTSFPSAREALLAALPEDARVVAFGEYHETAASGPAPSALHHFIAELLPVVAPRASDLVVETWLTDGKCGAEEQTVTADVAATTERPEHTESEVVTLLRRAKEAHVQPHVLTMSCADYTSLHDEDGEVDYARMLTLISTHLEDEIGKALRARAGAAHANGIILSYGGALHNDVYPLPELAPFTFGRSLVARTEGRYLEVDLYVPEYVEKDARIPKEAWWKAALAHARAGRTALVERGPASYIILFPRSPPTVAPAPGAAPSAAGATLTPAPSAAPTTAATATPAAARLSPPASRDGGVGAPGHTPPGRAR